MKIAYILSHNIDSNDGVVKKIYDQINAWQRTGHQVEVFTLCKGGNKSLLTSRVYPFQGAIKSRLFANQSLIQDVDTFAPDIVYFRYDFWNASVYKLAAKYPLVVESNTASLFEASLQLKTEKSIKALLRYTSLIAFHRLFETRIKGVVSVTSELFDLEYKGKTIPNVTITNSVNLENYRPLKSVDANAKTSLCFLGSPNQAWHGLDIIEKLAKALPDYHFHIIGDKGSNTNNVTYHGFLNKDAYNTILATCHIAIGTLALHRKGMTQACPLKVREYLLAGFPVILGYDDVINDNKPTWCFELNDLNENSIKALSAFVEKQKCVIVPKEQLACIDIQTNEQKRLEFLQQVYALNE
ncbi:hypothetical protein PALB_11650 [Pseudoalteromonas luteoviolacea B = ATCC 29581]|nr:hypothetical protein PALB_11650 [Pseudoalteromonas luteoviolacea B = ATCC 29581]